MDIKGYLKLFFIYPLYVIIYYFKGDVLKMTGKISSKRALVSAVLALLICVAMLVGTTFAWFTDTASTAVNKIQAGNLDVELWQAEADKSLGDEALKWVAADNRAQDQILWEPGCSYNLEGFRIKNNGNLALKYKIAITGIVGDAELLDVIDFTVKVAGSGLVAKDGTSTVTDIASLNGFEGRLAAGEATGVITINGEMSETAGNDYMKKSLDGISITVYATQDTVENDSFDNTYDEKAFNPVFVNDEQGLKAALSEGKNVRITGDIRLTNGLRVEHDAVILGDGKSVISGATLTPAADANVTVKDVNFKAPSNANENASNIDARGLKGKLVVDGCTFDGTQWDCIQSTPVAGAEIVINNCRFELTSPAKAGNKTRFIHVEAAQNSNSDVKITLTNNFFGSAEYITEALIDIDYVNLSGINFGGNNIYSDTKADIYVCGPSVSRTISKADAYKKLGTLKAGDQQALADAVSDGQKDIGIGEGEYTLYEVDESKTKNTALTITGSGPDVSSFTVGDQTDKTSGEGSADYSYEGSDLTFKNLTIKMKTDNYQGFIRAKSLTFENCVFEGMGSQWGAGIAVFKNCTFSDNGGYNMWLYAGKDFKFINCTFNSSVGRFINAYKVQKVDTTMEFENCSFNYTGNSAPQKPAVCFKRNADVIWNATFTGCTSTGAVDSGSGSNMYYIESGMNTATTITIDGTVVWENGANK